MKYYKDIANLFLIFLACLDMHIIKNNTKVRINVSWFGKFNAFFIFYDTVSPTFPEKCDTKEGFCFLNRGTKTNPFLAVKEDKKVKKEFYMIRISLLLKKSYAVSLLI